MMTTSRWTRTRLVTVVAAACLALIPHTNGQVKTKEATTSGTPTTEVNVERGEVVSVSGNDLVLKMESGEIRHFPNIPESARVTVDGKELGIHDLQPGMKLERTITTTTTPQVITTVQNVTGTVYHVQPPTSVILTLENGEHQQFKIPSGQKFTIDGRETDAWGLKKGMKITATKIVEEPVTVVDQQRQVAGTMPPPPPVPPANTPMLIVAGAEVPPPVAAPAPSTTTTARAELPQTGSFLPLIGLLGLLSIGASYAAMIRRRP